jgi:hypothetical protein
MKRILMIGGDQLPVLALVSLMSCWICLATACGSDETDSEATHGGSSGQSDTTGGGGTGADTGGAGAAGNASSVTGGAGGDTGTGGGPSDDDCRVWLDPNGTDSEGCGSADDPCATLTAAYNSLCPVPPEGTENGAECLGPAPRTLCVRPGTYQVTERFELRKTRMGTESNPIIIQAAPSATSKPVFDFSNQPRVAACGAQSDSSGGELTGITMNADWTVLRNVVVTDANDNCVKVQGANNLVEGVVVHGCDDAGIQISAGSGYANSGTNNTIVNCDSYQNHDPQCLGMNADGFAVKTGTGLGNVFRGCRAWDNADDGWDLGAWTDPVRVENCWAINQCASVADDRSDCNGFMLGANDVSAQHVLVDLIAVGNHGGASGCGFTPDTNPASLTCDGTCAAWDNDTDVVAIGGVSTAQIGSVTAEQMINAERGADGSLPDINSL